MLRWALVVLMAAVPALVLTAQAEQAAGVWIATAVEGHSLPAVTWKKTDGGRECYQETLASTLLLDSAGKWAALLTVRDRCKGDPAPKRGEGSSMIVSGTYAVSGQLITMQSEHSGEMRGAISAEEITILINGALEHEGQTATFAFKRARR